MSSSNVTIFSRFLVTVVALPPLAIVEFPVREFEFIDGVTIVIWGLNTEGGGGGGTAISLIAAARLNSLTLRGTKYSKSNEPSCCCC